MEEVFYTHENYKDSLRLKVSTKTHGMARSYTHRIWKSIKTRCLSKNVARYKNYSGRGIGICEKWLRFEGFFQDMGLMREGLGIDRIDNNKGYCKENCRIVTSSVNCANRRRSRKILHRGVYKVGDRYRSIMRVLGSNYHLGYFDSAEMAKSEYDKNAREWWGDRLIQD